MKLTDAESSVKLLCLALTPQVCISVINVSHYRTARHYYLLHLSPFISFILKIQVLKGNSGIFVVVPVDHLRGEPHHGSNGYNVSFGVTMTVFTTV